MSGLAENEDEQRKAIAAKQAMAREQGEGIESAAEQKNVDEMLARQQHDQDIDALQKQMVGAQARRDAAFAGKEDPEHWWSSRDAFQKAGATIALAIGGFAQGFAHLPSNIAADMIAKNIRDDIDSQRENLAADRKGAEEGVADIQRHMGETQDEYKAKLLALRDKFEDSKTMVMMQAQKTGGDPTELLKDLDVLQKQEEQKVKLELSGAKVLGGKHPINVNFTGEKPPVAEETGGPSAQQIAAGYVPPERPVGSETSADKELDKLSASVEKRDAGKAKAAPSYAEKTAAALQAKPAAQQAKGPPTPATIVGPASPGPTAAAPGPREAGAPSQASSAPEAETFILRGTNKNPAVRVGETDEHLGKLKIGEAVDRHPFHIAAGTKLPDGRVLSKDVTADGEVWRLGHDTAQANDDAKKVTAAQRVSRTAPEMITAAKNGDYDTVRAMLVSLKQGLQAIQGAGGGKGGLGLLQKLEEAVDPRHILETVDAVKHPGEALAHAAQRAGNIGQKELVAGLGDVLKQAHADITDVNRTNDYAARIELGGQAYWVGVNKNRERFEPAPNAASAAAPPASWGTPGK
jgi:hypothetical protein